MASQKGIDKWKAKKWFSVKAPKAFNDAVIGEMPANDEKAALGRNIVVSLDVITHNPSHSYTNVTLKVVEVTGDAAITRLSKMELVPAYLRSFVRRYRSVSSAVIPATSKDGTGTIVKLIAITRARADHTKLVGVRKEMITFTLNYFKDNDIGQIVGAIVEGKFQGELGSKLRHIIELNKVEVRKLEIKV
jgi:small subunit ribosomal protein S3Ae